MKKLIQNIRLFFHGVFWGLRSADQVISLQVNGEEEEINHKLETPGNVYDDMLQEKETQRVQETRDALYRVYREADTYDVSVSGMKRDGENFDDDESVLTAKATKKVALDKPKSPVFETKGYKPILIQNAKDYENSINIKEKEGETGEAVDDLSTLIFEIAYKDGLTPRFHIERYIQKLVIKENKNKKYKVDLYFSQYARQFVKRDSLFIAELSKIFDGTKRTSDMLDIETITFVTDKAYGYEDLHKITLSGINYKSICVFDGSFVLEFDCKKDDLDVVEKYKTKELDEKYATNAFKHENPDINAILRKEELDKEKENNFETTTLKL